MPSCLSYCIFYTNYNNRKVIKRCTNRQLKFEIFKMKESHKVFSTWLLYAVANECSGFRVEGFAHDFLIKRMKTCTFPEEQLWQSINLASWAEKFICLCCQVDICSW